MRLADVETPALIADRARIERNAKRMRDRLERHGVALRPHLKTTKSAAIARIAHGGAIGPGTVSTLHEAEYFLDHGFDDLTYAVCITANKFAHVASLVERGAKLKVLLADSTTVGALAEYAASRGVPIAVMVEIDCGDHRTGLAPFDEDLVACARVVAEADRLELAGLLTHGGHSYACRSTGEILAVADEERQALLDARSRLVEQGIDVPILSAGSTPTAALGKRFDGLDEMRPGVYLAGDLFQLQLGTCGFDDIAVSVLATVIARDRAANRIVVDAGGLALSKDRSTADAPVDYGYGLIVRADGSRFDADPVVSSVSQEHGEVTSGAALPFDELAVGTPVRVLPNHVCMTAASYDRYYVTDGPDGAIVDEWHKASGW